MANNKMLGIVVAIVIIIAVVAVAAVWQAGYFNQPEATPTPTPTPEVTPTPTPTETATPEPSPTPEVVVQEQVRDAVMTYIETNHNDTTQYMQDLNWSGGRETGGGLGAETYNYCSGDWSVQIKYPVVLNPIYNVAANYTGENATIMWKGTYQDASINETVYTNSALPIQEQVRNDIVNFLRTNHTETMGYLQNLEWTGGNITPEGLVGSVTYSYQSTGWNVTMTYPVVPDPIYTITAQYVSPVSQVTPEQTIFDWQGTWQNCTITETSYTYTP